MKVLIFLFIGLITVIALLYGSLVYLNSEKEIELTELMTKDSTDSVKSPLSKVDSLTNIVQTKEPELTKKENNLDSLQKDKIKQEQFAKSEARENKEEIKEK